MHAFILDDKTADRIRLELVKAKARGLSASEVCCLSGIDPSNLHKMQVGKRPIGIISAVRLCVALGLNYRLAIGGRKTA